MITSSIHCKIHQTSDLSEIISILKQIPLTNQPSSGILIGSRAARYYLPNFRQLSHDNNADWDIILSSETLLKWLDENSESLNTINAVIPTANDGVLLDFYLYNTSKYDFIVPQSSTSYTAYLLNNQKNWIVDDWNWRREPKFPFIKTATVKLLFILKRYMLYYSHQWEKTAKDYHQLLAVTDPLTDDDTILCNLFVLYNEKTHGQRPLDYDEFIIHPTDTRKGIIINREDFFQDEKDKQISLIYQTAMTLSIAGDILIGLEYICTQGPLWLADYVINNWMNIQQEKYKQNYEVFRPCIEFPIENHRLFPEIPEFPSKRILRYITNTSDFHSMQLVCKKWYTILNEEIFWRDLYISRYGSYSGNIDHIKSWKILYFIRLEGRNAMNKNTYEQLVDATIELNKYTANDILQLWEDLTHQNQLVDSRIMSKINYILLNVFYYHIEKTSDHYLVGLSMIGLEHTQSRSNVFLKLWVGQYGSMSRFSDQIEELSIGISSSNDKPYHMTFLGPELMGFHFMTRGYGLGARTYLSQTPDRTYAQYPSGLLVCLFIMMVHPDHRGQFIKYLKKLEKHCLELIMEY
jgi:hypothetical protein